MVYKFNAQDKFLEVGIVDNQYEIAGNLIKYFCQTNANTHIDKFKEWFGEENGKLLFNLTYNYISGEIDDYIK